MDTNRQFQLVPIRRTEVYREVLTQLEAYISENGLRAGDRLPPDRELSERLGVSRASVRQAIKVLESLGRVSARQGSGTYVCDVPYGAAVSELTRGLAFDASFLRQLIPLRTTIEFAVFSEAFERRTPKNLVIIQSALDKRARMLDEDSEEGDLMVSFEAALGMVCGNELMRRTQNVVHAIWVQAWVGIGVAPGDKFLLHREHVEIFERFRAGEREEAMALFRAHLNVERFLDALVQGIPLRGLPDRDRTAHQRNQEPITTQ